MITNEYLQRNIEEWYDKVSVGDTLVCKLKTHEECKKILGNNLRSVFGTLQSTKEHIQQSSKDNVLTFKVLKKPIDMGVKRVEIREHPRSIKRYVGAIYELDIFEPLDSNTFKGL